MTAMKRDWRADFGLQNRKPPHLFTDRSELTPSTPQAHLLRRAFDVLEVNGVLCVDHSPLAYFKIMETVTGEQIAELHRQFWNHGGASLLLVITDDRIHLISGMTPPDGVASGSSASAYEVEPAISRTADKLKALIVAMESGEYFRRHARSFDPKQRVDRHLLDNLQDTRGRLSSATRQPIALPVLNSLLCRLVFTCYLFDRGVIGRQYLADLGIAATDLRDVLGIRPLVDARDLLYRLFDKLKDDFNGDLFIVDLAEEKNLVHEDHMRTLHTFLEGMSIVGGQGVMFRLYDFKFIPIETISAIYERFLNAEELNKGAFYTPRFLAEIVLDTALHNSGSLIGKRFLDPACGSGIFLVGLFNRIAEEWSQANPTARNDRKARELMRLLQESLFGVDVSLTACRITAFSLYLAYLDQLSPPDIQGLQRKGRALPRLVRPRGEPGANAGGNIREADFFEAEGGFVRDAHLVVGNPPWGSIATEGTEAGAWCAANDRLLPDKQIAAAFIWKATLHVAEEGRICFILPHGVLFNHGTTAIQFQKAWVRAHAMERVLNLADFQRFLFEKAGHPAVVVSYLKSKPADLSHRIDYWGPKADWMVTKAEVISVAPQDRSSFTIRQLLNDLSEPDAPQLWKQRFSATPRDWRLIDRLAIYPRLRDVVRQPREKLSTKRWLIAEGFQPFGENDPEKTRRRLTLPGNRFINANSRDLDLFLLEDDCKLRTSPEVIVRRRIQNTDIFRAPHVIVSKGFSSIAFADFDVSFQHALRGITGPVADRDLLIFLAAYLRSPLARYFLFHTSSNWGISRQEAHVEEVLRLPFPLPDQLDAPERAQEIVARVAQIVDDASRQADADFVDREAIIRTADKAILPLINEYFDLIPYEADLIDDTSTIVIESARPTRAQKVIPTLVPANARRQRAYSDRVCEMLNGWANKAYAVRGEVIASELLGIGVAVLEKVSRSQANKPIAGLGRDLLPTLDAVRKLVQQTHATIDLVRGVMVYDGPRLYVVKPISQRYWTLTAAMNDADEIATSILMRPSRGGA